MTITGAAALGVAVALAAGTAQAQQGEFAGMFSFQTGDMLDGPRVQILSGDALADLQDDGSYRVRLLATDFLQNADGTSSRVHAIQLCTGKPEGEEMLITCQVLNSTVTNYIPDSFRLRQVPDTPAFWRGTLESAGSVSVEFIDQD